MKRLKQMMKTTAFRLTVVYSLIFGLLAIGVVYYIGYNTGRLLISQFQTAVDEEVSEIARMTSSGGVRRLIPLIERRSRRPGANLYLIADPTGRIIAGNVRELDRQILRDDGWRVPPFSYIGFDDEERTRSAIARVFTLPGDLRLLVGRDVGDAQQFRTIVLRASTLSLLVMVLTAVALWFFIGRRALKHIDSVSRSSSRIIAGDLSQRLPISGSGDEFDRLSGNLNSLLERIEKLNSGLSSMSDSIAHDLKTPLTRLRSRAELALTQEQGSEEVFQDIIGQADGLIRTFDALLMISQVDSGARTANLSKINLKPILADVFELFEPSAEEKGIQFSLTMKTDASVRGNRELLAQAMTNLLDNALKYGSGSSSPTLELQLTVEAKQACISIIDNGSGIKEKDRNRVTDRFVRLDKSRNKPGSGLGLALVKAVVALHNGQLVLEDADPGLRTKIVLPIAK